jgi:hypothetical protein
MKEQQYRRLQILAVASGVVAALASLVGAVIQNALLAQAGAAGFLLALAAVVFVGILAWRRFG